MSTGRWSDILAAIVKSGGPITPHPDAETVRLLAKHEPKRRSAAEYLVTRLEPPLDLDEAPPPPIPARPYKTINEHRAERGLPPFDIDQPVPNPPTRRGWRRLFRRAA